MKERSGTKKLVMTSLFAAIIMIFTSSVRLGVGANGGYIHFGDAMIYLAACMLPVRCAATAAMLGGALADIFVGSAVWAFPTAIIKALNAAVFAFVCGFGKDVHTVKLMSVRTVTASIFSGAVTVVGYFIAEWLMYGFAGAAVSVPASVIQAAGSSALFCAVSGVTERVRCIRL